MFSRAWRDNIDSQMASEATFCAGLHEIVLGLNDRNVPPTALDDVVSQPWRHSRRDWYDAAALIEVGLHLQAGWCVVTVVPINATPGRDRDEQSNQAKLDELPQPFSARCESGKGDDDGWLAWDAPISIRHVMDNGAPLLVRFPPSGIPLEIGHTEPETTIWHMRREGGVARWPYGAERITLLLCTCSTTGRPVPLAAPEVLEGGWTPLPERGPTSIDLLTAELAGEPAS
jgi:hypothetical protein